MVKQAKHEDPVAIKKSSKVTEVEEIPLEEDGEKSLTIAQKKRNAKILEKATNKMFAKVKKCIEKKQVIKAVTSLITYSKKQKEGNLVKKLLEDEDDSVYVTFTLT